MVSKPMLGWGCWIDNWPIFYAMKMKNSIGLDYIEMKMQFVIELKAKR
jgi:hypothetical protein